MSPLTPMMGTRALAAGQGAGPISLSWLAEQNPPFSFQREDGSAAGIAVDVLAEMHARLAEPMPKVEVVPWPRGYWRVSNEPGAVLFAMARTQEREPLFRWVGPIYPLQIGVVARRDRGLKIREVGDLQGLVLGTVRDGAPEQLLQAAGVPDRAIERAPGLDANLRKLQAGRVDAVAFNVAAIRYRLKAMGFDPDQYELVYVLQRVELCYAFHRDADPERVARYQEALDALHFLGRVDAIVSAYLD